MRFGFVHCLLTCPHCLPQSATNKGTWRSNTLEKHCLKPFKNRHFSIYRAIGFTAKYFLKTQENPVLCNSKGTLTDMHRLTWRMFSQRTRPALTSVPQDSPQHLLPLTAGHTAAGFAAGRLWCIWKGACASSELLASNMELSRQHHSRWDQTCPNCYP